jgi:hypothetical protein
MPPWISTAEESLAETEGRLEINESDLCRALELAEDIAGIYEIADERTRRGYNQAFFTRIKIRARWDDGAGRTAVEVVGVELTEPYAVLLAEQTTKEALAWVEAIKVGERPQKAGKRLQKPHLQLPKALSGDDISIYEVLAEGERFELSVRLSDAQRFSRPPHSTALPPLQGDAPKASGSAPRGMQKPASRCRSRRRGA